MPPPPPPPMSPLLTYDNDNTKSNVKRKQRKARRRTRTRTRQRGRSRRGKKTKIESAKRPIARQLTEDDDSNHIPNASKCDSEQAAANMEAHKMKGLRFILSQHHLAAAAAANNNNNNRRRRRRRRRLLHLTPDKLCIVASALVASVAAELEAAAHEIGEETKSSNSSPSTSSARHEQPASDEHTSEFKLALTFVYLIIFVIGVCGNVCNCLVIADSRNRYMKTATNYYLFSLSVSDLILLTFGLPHDLVNLWHPSPYLFNSFVCISRGWISEASTYASVLVIVAFTVERYLAICHPLKAHTLSRLSRAIKIIILIWLVASSCALLVVWQFGIQTVMVEEEVLAGDQSNTTTLIRQTRAVAQCTIVSLNESTFELSVLVFFIIPMAVITILYMRLGYYLRQKTSVIKKNRLDRARHLSQRAGCSGELLAANGRRPSSASSVFSQATSSVFSSTVRDKMVQRRKAKDRRLSTGCKYLQFSGIKNKKKQQVRIQITSSSGSGLAAAGPAQIKEIDKPSQAQASCSSYEEEEITMQRPHSGADTPPSPELKPSKVGRCCLIACTNCIESGEGNQKETLNWTNGNHDAKCSVELVDCVDRSTLPAAGRNDGDELVKDPLPVAKQQLRKLAPHGLDAGSLRGQGGSVRLMENDDNGGGGGGEKDDKQTRRGPEDAGSECCFEKSGARAKRDTSNIVDRETPQMDLFNETTECDSPSEICARQEISGQRPRPNQLAATPNFTTNSTASSGSSSSSSSTATAVFVDLVEAHHQPSTGQQQQQQRRRPAPAPPNHETNCSSSGGTLIMATQKQQPMQRLPLQTTASSPAGVAKAPRQKVVSPTKTANSSNSNFTLNSTVNTSSTRSVIKMLVSVVVMFFVCWAPFHAQRLMAIYVLEPTSQQVFVFNLLNHISGISYYVSAVANPILYSLLSMRFRQAFRDTFGSIGSCTLCGTH